MDADDAGRSPLYVYSGSFATEPRLRRILAVAGWDVTTGVPGDGGWVGVWGNSATSGRGEAVAGATDAQILRIEDAPLRSVLPARAGGGAPLGLTLDRTGVHYDGTRPSDLETLLATAPFDDTVALNRAKRAIEQLRHWHLGKYSATDPALPVPPPGYVVVLDQCREDASLLGAGRADFKDMLAAAQIDHPGAPIVIRSHPEADGGRQGHFDDADADDRTTILREPVSLWTLLDGAIAVYTHSSMAGFEAIFAGHRPRVFGQPFYAGWKLTDDQHVFPRRNRELTRAQIFAGAVIDYPVWYDPIRDAACAVEDVIASLAAQAVAHRQDRQGWIGAGMRRWKRPHFKRAFPGIRFARTAEAGVPVAARTGRRLLLWGTSGRADMTATRVEDGVLRSRGLGADLTAPVSLGLDDEGLSLDPAKSSRMERLIAESVDLPLAEMQRADRLVAEILRLGLTKYNISGGGLPELPEGRRILVVGQVEDDASVLLGTSTWRTNAELLAEARARNPAAIVMWKPHPDVEAGLRKGAVPDADQTADVVLNDVSAVAAMAVADEVWTLTSGLGFEALLRGIPVTCLGLPFYAGWGLTTDLVAPPGRRAARPTLTGLAHAALIGHPRYVDPVSGQVLSAEQGLVVLDRPARPRSRLARVQRLVRKLGL